MANANGQADYVANPSAGYLNAEARRPLDAATYSSNRLTTVQVPRDTVLKAMLLNLVLSCEATYASGTPLFAETGLMDRLCPQVEFIINGNRVLKSVKPHMLRMHNAIESGSAPTRRYNFSAAVDTNTRAGFEWMGGTLANPSTTQFLQYNESCRMWFELPFNYIGSSGYDTECDIRDVASADLKFYFANIQNILQDGNSAPVTYANVIASIKTQIIENRARPRPQPGDVMYDYVESTITRQISGQQTGYQIELQTGNYLAALGFLVKNGDTNKSLAENLVTGLLLRINGSTAIQGPVDHDDLQDDNIARYGVNSPAGVAAYAASTTFVSRSHVLKGFAFMNLLRNGSWNTAINTSRAAGIDTVKAELNTPSSSGTDAATYTNPLEVAVHTHEIRPFLYTR